MFKELMARLRGRQVGGYTGAGREGDIAGIVHPGRFISLRDVELAQLIVNAMRTQQEDEPFPAYIGVDGLENVVIDGGFDILALARAILDAGYTKA